MKISKIAKLCKDTKCVEYAVDGRGLWLGNGCCAFLIPEFSELSQEGIALALGIAEKEKSKYRFMIMDLSDFNIEDIDEKETPCLQMDFIAFRGSSVPFKTEDGIRFLQVDMVNVLKDELENIEIYMRRAKDGRACFVAKVGMYIKGLFMPERVINADFINKLNEFNNLCRVTYQNDEAKAQECAPSADETQMQLEGAKE